MPTSLEAIRGLVTNALPDEVPGAFIGLIGERASTYSRSPQIWTAALACLQIEATYLPLDVEADRLEALVARLRQTSGCLGANVTVPYKEAVLPLLDDVNPTATAAGAVNTVVRSPDGRLSGRNTDGVGLVDALLASDEGPPLVETLYGLTVLLVGAGGAARAAAVALAPLLGPGELLVANRREDRAEQVAARAAACGGRARTVAEGALDDELPRIGLVINASLRGQVGILRGPGGWTSLEPYSALAPAHPAGVEANHATSRARMRLLPRDAVVFDMIYAPPLTTTMRHAREAGLRAANGRWMIIAQAAEALVGHICAAAVAASGHDALAARDLVTGVMAAAWPPEDAGPASP